MPPKTDTHITQLPATIPFIAPERIEREQGAVFDARLGANENNFGCSPRAIEAMADAAEKTVGQYCDPECFELRQLICAKLGIDLSNIVIGPGIDGLLGLIVRIFSSSGDTILTSMGAYPTFNYHVAAYGRRLEMVPYADDHEDLSALAAAAQKLKPAMVYVSNPDNPMGTWWDALQIEAFIAAVPAETLVILDEAYGETAPEGTLPDIDCGVKNVLRLRTFSKAYGLAGLRCGYAIGHPELIAPFDKVRDHFGVNIMAQMAAAAAFEDQDWLAQFIDHNAQARDRIAAIAADLGLTALPSATNFVTIDCGRDGAFAQTALEQLLQCKIFVRKPMAPGLDRCIRISTGPDAELDHFEAAFRAVMEQLS